MCMWGRYEWCCCSSKVKIINNSFHLECVFFLFFALSIFHDSHSQPAQKRKSIKEEPQYSWRCSKKEFSWQTSQPQFWGESFLLEKLNLFSEEYFQVKIYENLCTLKAKIPFYFWKTNSFIFADKLLPSNSL